MINRFETALGVKAFPTEFDAIYTQACAEYAREGTFFLDADYLARVQAEFNIFPNIAEPLLEAAEKLRADNEAALYALFVFRAMEQRTLFLAHLPLVEFPAAHPFFSFFCLIPTIPPMVEALKARGLPADVIAQTVGQFEDCVFLYQKRFAHLGLSKRYFDHMQSYVDCKILNIGRLRYERIRMHDPLYLLEQISTGEQILVLGEGEMRADGLYADTPPQNAKDSFPASFREEADAYIGTPVMANGKCAKEVIRFPKDDYRLRLRPGDTCISVHIPDKGALTKENCEKSYRRADDLFRRCYPEFKVNAYHCHSWMLAPELAEILKPDANLLTFQRRYARYPVHTAGEDVMNFVFNLKGTTYADLPEDTSLQRALKQRYLGGGFLYEYGGIFTIDR